MSRFIEFIIKLQYIYHRIHFFYIELSLAVAFTAFLIAFSRGNLRGEALIPSWTLEGVLDVLKWSKGRVWIVEEGPVMIFNNKDLFN